MKYIFLYLILIFMSGCVQTKTIDGNVVKVQGIGIDTTFYPVFAIRIGAYKYYLITKKNNSYKETIIIK